MVRRVVPGRALEVMMLAVIIASGCRPPVPQQVIVPEAHPQPVVPVVGSVTIGPWGWTPVRERRPYLVTQRALITTRQDTLTRIDTVTSELATAFTQFVQANRISGSLTSFRVATGTRAAATPAGVTVPITIAANAVPSGYGATPQWSITTPVEGSPCSSAAWTVVQGVRDLWFRAPDTLRLLPHLSVGPDYFVLAISQNHARVFRANRLSIEPFEVKDLPKSLEDALWYVHREPTMERHGSGAGHMSGGGQQYHKNDIHQYLHQVDKALGVALAGSHAPLVVMGVGYEASMFINESHYRHVVHTPVSGNPDQVDLLTIHARTWAVVSEQIGRAHV